MAGTGRHPGLLSDPATIFRALVICSAAALVCGLVTPYVEARFMSDETLDLLSRNGHDALLSMPSGVFWLSNLLWLAVSVGVYQFSASARAVFALFVAASLLQTPFYGVSVLSPLIGSLGYVNILADGAILALAYAAPLKSRFR